jgi:hypothetical protein
MANGRAADVAHALLHAAPALLPLQGRAGGFEVEELS